MWHIAYITINAKYFLMPNIIIWYLLHYLSIYSIKPKKTSGNPISGYTFKLTRSAKLA